MASLATRQSGAPGRGVAQATNRSVSRSPYHLPANRVTEQVQIVDKEIGMFARVSSFRGAPDKIEGGIRALQETTSAIQQLPGFQRAFFLVDRGSGRAVSITLWESEEAVNRTTSAANPLRDRVAQALGVSEKPAVEVFEVAEEIPQRARKAA